VPRPTMLPQATTRVRARPPTRRTPRAPASVALHAGTRVAVRVELFPSPPARPRSIKLASASVSRHASIKIELGESSDKVKPHRVSLREDMAHFQQHANRVDEYGNPIPGDGHHDATGGYGCTGTGVHDAGGHGGSGQPAFGATGTGVHDAGGAGGYGPMGTGAHTGSLGAGHHTGTHGITGTAGTHGAEGLGTGHTDMLGTGTDGTGHTGIHGATRLGARGTGHDVGTGIARTHRAEHKTGGILYRSGSSSSVRLISYFLINFSQVLNSTPLVANSYDTSSHSYKVDFIS
jgi:hypothetical protein